MLSHLSTSTLRQRKGQEPGSGWGLEVGGVQGWGGGGGPAWRQRRHVRDSTRLSRLPRTRPKNNESPTTTHLRAVLGEELNRGETVDFDVFKFIGSRVHLSNDDVSVVLVFLAQFVPRGRELFAVAAPRRVELYENVLVLVPRNVVKILANENFHGLRVPVVRDFFRHQMWLKRDFSVEFWLPRTTWSHFLVGNKKSLPCPAQHFQELSRPPSFCHQELSGRRFPLIWCRGHQFLACTWSYLRPGWWNAWLVFLPSWDQRTRGFLRCHRCQCRCRWREPGQTTQKFICQKSNSTGPKFSSFCNCSPYFPATKHFFFALEAWSLQTVHTSDCFLFFFFWQVTRQRILLKFAHDKTNPNNAESNSKAWQLRKWFREKNEMTNKFVKRRDVHIHKVIEEQISTCMQKEKPVRPTSHPK